MRRFWFQLALTSALLLLLVCAPYVLAQGGKVWTDALRFNVSAQTCADNGSGTASSITVTTLKTYVELTQNDANGCAITISETTARQGDTLTIENISTNSATIADSSGVQEVKDGSTITLGQYQSVMMVYKDRWVQASSGTPANEVSTTNTATLTGKTYDAEGTGNVLTLPFTMHWIGATCDVDVPYAANWQSTAATNPNVSCVSGSNVLTAKLDFEDTETQSVFNHFRLPGDWTGTIALNIHWLTTATTGNVVWQIQTACAADNESINPSLNTAQTIVDAAKGSASLLNIATLSSVTTTGCAAGEEFWFKILRDPTHASDTIGAAASILSVDLTYRRAI